jgi:competence protein ComEA
MNKKLLEQYFSFSRKERNAVLVLVLLITIIFVIPYWLPQSNKKLDAELIEAIHTSTFAENTGNIEVNRKTSDRVAAYSRADRYEARKEIRFFPFDPNTISPEAWLTLGLKQRTVETIAKYLSRGGKFRKAEDLRKIFGLSQDLADKLMPYVRIQAEHTRAFQTSFAAKEAAAYPEKRFPVKRAIDINKADSAEFVTLDGIGPTLAGRIIKFRDRLGGFYALVQLAEVYGLPDSSFQKLAPDIIISTTALKKIDINNGDLQALSQHPYIGRKLATVIIQYRQQHGKFNSVDQLGNIDIITPQLVKKISPYLVIED